MLRSHAQSRKFKAADGQEYRWTLHPDGEWQVRTGIHNMSRVFLLTSVLQCTNARSNYHVATYSMKPAGEPQYAQSSGCMLTVEEAYPHLIGGAFHLNIRLFHVLINLPLQNCSRP